MRVDDSVAGNIQYNVRVGDVVAVGRVSKVDVAPTADRTGFRVVPSTMRFVERAFDITRHHSGGGEAENIRRRAGVRLRLNGTGRGRGGRGNHSGSRRRHFSRGDQVGKSAETEMMREGIGVGQLTSMRSVRGGSRHRLVHGRDRKRWKCAQAPR